MTLYTPDHDYIEGKRIIESLNPTVDKERLIQYYVKKQEKHIAKLNKIIGEYQAVFNAIDHFLPNHNPTFNG